MSAYITQIAIVDDCLRLMQVSNDVNMDFHLVSYSHEESARLGSLAFLDQSVALTLLERIKERWSQRQPEQQLEQKLCFVLGWLARRAAEQQILSALKQSADHDECAIYYDLFIFHEVFEDGHRTPFDRSLLTDDIEEQASAAHIDATTLEQLFRTLLQRALLGIQTPITLDENDPESSVEHILDLHQRYVIDSQRYAEIFAQPDPQKIQQYITDSNFYDSEEPYIRVARAVQHRDELRATYVEQAFATEAKSLYGQTIQLGYRYLLAASHFFEDKLSLDELQTLLNSTK